MEISYLHLRREIADARQWLGFIHGSLVVLFRTIVNKSLFQLVETKWVRNKQDSKHRAQARGTGWMRCLKLL